MDPTEGYDLNYVGQHLLKFREIVDACTQKLPQLQSIELKLHTYCWGEMILARIKATNKNGVLSVNWGDVVLQYYHEFGGFNGSIPGYDD
jgi:hypothetical protein